MKKIIAMALCLVLAFSLVSCGNKVDLDEKPTITGKVIDWWGTSVTIEVSTSSLDSMLMYGKEASNRKQEIDRQHYTIPNQRPKDKHCGKI